MRFALLGPVQVYGEDGLLEIRGTLRRTLLAALLLHRGSVVSADRLGEMIWGERPPASVTTSLYNQIMRLRQALGEDAERIRAVSPGYLIHVEPGELDLDEFARLCADARQAASAADWLGASNLHSSALSLWRGEILADAPSLQEHPSIHQFTEDRLVALQGRIDADLNLARHDTLIGELRTLTVSHPLREAFHAQLMLALYRAGRQADALDVYRDLRRATVTELGVEPGQALRDLHRRILRSDPGLKAPLAGSRLEPVAQSEAASRTTSRQLPVDTRFFTGRAAELDELLSLAKAAGDGANTGMVVITAINGMGGIGKTALAVRAAHRVSIHFPDGQLFIDLRGFDPEVPPLAPEDALDYLLRSLAVRPDEIPTELDERAALYRSKLAETRTLIVLDNAVSTAQVQPLLPGTPGCLVLVTSRNRLMGLDDAYLLALGALPSADARALLHDAAGRGRIPECEPVDELTELCGRVPLAIRIVAARLRHRSALTVTALCAELREERSRLDRLSDGERDLVSVFDSSLAVLADEEQRLFRFLGLIPGQDFDAYAAAHLIGTDLRTAEGLLETLLDHNLLIQQTPGRFRLHDLLRVHASGLAAADEQSPAALDRLFDFYLHTAQAADLHIPWRRDRPLSREATPVPEPAPGITDRGQALAWMHCERANLLAVLGHQGAHSADSHRMALLTQAMIPFCRQEGPWSLAAIQRALRLHRRSGFRQGVANALQEIGRRQLLAGEYDDAVRMLEEALAIHLELGFRLGEGNVYWELGRIRFALGDHAEALRLHSWALELFRNLKNAYQSTALRELARVHNATGDPKTAAELARQALSIAVEMNDPISELEVRNLIAALESDSEGPALALNAFRENADMAEKIGQPLELALALEGMGRCEIRLNRRDSGLVHLRRAVDLYKQMEAVEYGSAAAYLAEIEGQSSQNQSATRSPEIELTP